MTACVNRKHTKKVAAVVTASLVGALSLGVAPVAAVADTGIETLASDLQNWQNGEFEFSSDLGNNGAFNLKDGDTLSFVSATDAAGNEYGASDATVLFFSNNSSSIQPANTLVDADDTIAGRAGTMPKVAGTYWVVVFQGDILDGGELFNYQDTTQLSELTVINGNYKAFKLNVSAKTTALGDVEAFQYDASASDKGMADTEFNYTGTGLNIGFKAGDKLLEDSDYDVVWISTPNGQPTQSGDYFTATSAGTYTVRLKGDGTNYTGTVDVTFEIKGIDLSSADIAVSPVETGSLTLAGGNVLDNKYLTVNGVALHSDADMTCTLIAKNDAQVSSVSGALTTGKYTFRVTDDNTSNNDVKGSAVIDLYVVDNAVAYTYNGDPVTTSSIDTFNPAMGSTFTPDAFAATANGKKVPFTVKVTKDGKEVTSYTEPGTYKVVLDTPRSENADGTYAGHIETSFKVWGVNYSTAVVYVSIDGKNVQNNSHVDYTGTGSAPVVVARNADNEKLVEGTDYTWKFVDAEGNEIESATEVGSYKVVVTFADGTEQTVAFSIDKAEILSAKATADFFAIPADGSAAVPTFVGSTNKDYDKGTKFNLDADKISVAYYNAKKLPNGDLVLNNGNPQIDMTSRVDAKDLTKAGTYFAMINVLSTAENIEGSKIEVPFVLAESVAFTDVDANAWYADPVYKAAELKYMNGISGTRLFMPEANITRAEIACVMFNMAGGQPDADKNYPTGFEDVAADTWYSQAVAWASQNGVINGYDTGLYGTFDNATREQVAAILYNYADAQGMDVSVDDADVTLAKFDDGAQVSDWAKEAVAWAVENGVMGNGGFLNPTGTITRAEVAAMAVNFQPEAL